MCTPAPKIEATASDYFAARIAEYDSLVRRAVPHYDELLDLLEVHFPKSARDIVELGCGTGTLSLRLARCYPDARITFIDAAAEMLDVTRQRLIAEGASRPDRFNLVAATFEDVELPDRQFNLITSNMALHHVIDKAALFQRIYDWLRPGGTLRFGDHVWGQTVGNREIGRTRWIAHCQSPGQLTEAELASLVQHRHQHDHYISVKEQFGIFERVGFSDPDCVWSDGNWAIYTAEKA